MEIEVDIGEVQSVAKVTACSGFDWDLYGNWGWVAYTKNFCFSCYVRDAVSLSKRVAQMTYNSLTSTKVKFSEQGGKRFKEKERCELMVKGKMLLLCSCR
ncbi:hypothetical protein ACB092_02G181700 [Castanea dentata]